MLTEEKMQGFDKLSQVGVDSAMVFA